MAQALAQALQRSGFDLYSDRRSDSASRAVDCLTGRTHYVDPDTRRFFRARVLSSRVLASGLFFGIVESASADCEHRSRIFRAVIFDIFGTVVYRPNLENSHKTRAAAEKDFWRGFEKVNPAEHYRAVLAGRAARMESDAAALRAIVGSI